MLDKAIEEGNPHGFAITLASLLPVKESTYQDTALPFAGSAYIAREKNPEQLRKMLRMYDYGMETKESRARNFYRQAAFMKDYEDDYPLPDSFAKYYPTYHDLSTKQLRGYFSWRTQARKGIWQAIHPSFAYIYLYELINGIGGDVPEDCLERMKEFEKQYLDAGHGNEHMRNNLHHWMLDYAIVNTLPQEIALDVADKKMIKQDKAIEVLYHPEEHGDEEVYAALCVFGVNNFGKVLMAREPIKAKHLIREAWIHARQDKETDVFHLFFGEQTIIPWQPFANAVFYEKPREDREYALDACRIYRKKNRRWEVTSYQEKNYNKPKIRGFLQQMDLMLRRYFKTGYYLSQIPGNAWAIPWIEKAIQEDKQAVLLASKPKITIDLSGLEQIRKDAAVTRDSLLTEEELQETEETETRETMQDSNAILDPLQRKILQSLLQGMDASPILQENHRMASIVADSINEAMFEEIGDMVLDCEDDTLTLVEDYIEDIERLLGGKENG